MTTKKTRKTETSLREGAWLVSAMEAAGIRNTELVERLSLNTENLVSQWRTGNCPMTDLQMLQVGRILNADVFSIRPTLGLYVDALRDRSYLDGLSAEEIADVIRYIGLLRGNKLRGEATMNARVTKIRPTDSQRPKKG